jgi:hypothetical protein
MHSSLSLSHFRFPGFPRFYEERRRRRPPPLLVAKITLERSNKNGQECISMTEKDAPVTRGRVEERRF